MMGSAKADLLRREDYSNLTLAPTSIPHRSSSASLWSGSPGASPSISAMQPGPDPLPEKNDSTSDSAMAVALSGQLANSVERKGYAVPKPNYAISSSGKIPDGFVAHARDECAVVDYQWDSMRGPLEFGDGGQFGEEWTHMHKRFRRGLKKLVDWYSTSESPTEMVTQSVTGIQVDDNEHAPHSEDEDVETVVIVVSHGAGCNALIGAITHQPVLMDVGIASITMAVKKPGADYSELLATSHPEASEEEPQVSPHLLYDIRISASTEHLRSSSSTPVSSRSTSSDAFATSTSNRGRAPSMGNSDGPGPLMGSFFYSDPLVPYGSRSNSASAALGSSIHRSAGSQRAPSRAPMFATGGSGSRSNSPGTNVPAFGLWSAGPSSLRLMDDGGIDEDDEDDFDTLLPNFGSFKSPNPEKKQGTTQDQILKTDFFDSDNVTPRFEITPRSPLTPALPSPAIPTLGPFSITSSGDSTPKSKPRGPVLSGPIRIRTDFDSESPPKELSIAQLGDGTGGLWGLPRPPGDAERFRDLSLSKRRWTTTERAQS